MHNFEKPNTAEINPEKEVNETIEEVREFNNQVTVLLQSELIKKDPDAEFEHIDVNGVGMIAAAYSKLIRISVYNNFDSIIVYQDGEELEVFSVTEKEKAMMTIKEKLQSL